MTSNEQPATSGAKVGDTEAQLGSAGSEQKDLELFEILKENIPYAYVIECLTLLQQLKTRLQSDIYRGILLEVVQRICNDV